MPNNFPAPFARQYDSHLKHLKLKGLATAGTASTHPPGDAGGNPRRPAAALADEDRYLFNHQALAIRSFAASCLLRSRPQGKRCPPNCR